MSYCVNCGVELGVFETKCPLCNTQVINPNKSIDSQKTKEKNPYPIRQENFSTQKERNLTAGIISLCLAFPAIVCFLIDLIYSKNLIWSFFVVGAMGMMWSFFVPLLLFEKPKTLLYIIIDFFAITGYLYLVECLTKGNWFLTLAFPITLSCGIVTLICSVLIKNKYIKGFFYIGALISITLAIFTTILEYIISVYHNETPSFSASIICGIALTFLALLFILAARRKRFKEEVKKRMHM